MSNKIDFNIQVLQTIIQIIYCDVATLDVDAIVCPDDILLTMKGSVATAISKVAGTVPRDDASKYPRPQPVGSVLVTSSGRLKARYIFHALTFDVTTSRKPETLFPQIVRRVLDLATTLGIERLATPLLMTGQTGLPKPQALKLMLQTLACRLIAQTSPLRQITIALYKVDAHDHDTAEQQLFEDIAPIREWAERWKEAAKRLNTRIELLQALSAAIPDDNAIDQMVKERIVADKAELSRFIDCPDALAHADDVAKENPLSDEEYERVHHRLVARIEDLASQINHLGDLSKIERERLRHQERLWRKRGDNTPAEVITEIAEINLRIEQYDHETRKAEEQHTLACRDLEALRQRRRTRRTAPDQ